MHRVGGGSCGYPGFKEADGLTHGGEPVRALIGDLDVETLLARHHNLDAIQAVGAQIFLQPCTIGQAPRFDAQMENEDLAELRSHVAHDTHPMLLQTI